MAFRRDHRGPTARSLGRDATAHLAAGHPVFGIKSMRVAAAARKFAVPSHHIRYLRRTGLLSNESAFLDFADLVRLQFIAECRRRHLSLQRIRRFLTTAGSGPADMERRRHPRLLDSADLVLVEPTGLVDPLTGQILFNYGRPAASGNQAQILELSRRMGDGGREARLTQLEGRFQDALARSKEEDVRRILEEILELEPDHSGALIELGNLAFEQERYADAEGYYDRAASYAPDCVEAIYNLANVYFRQRKYAAAIRSYQTSLSLDPDFPEAYYNLALVYFSLQHLEKAAHFFRCYLDLDPESAWRGQAEEFLSDIQQMQEGESPQLFGHPIDSSPK